MLSVGGHGVDFEPSFGTGDAVGARVADQNAREIADEISGLSNAAQGIDTHAEKLAIGIDELVAILPTVQRLTEIVDPLDKSVVRLSRFVDLLPGDRRTQRSSQP